MRTFAQILNGKVHWVFDQEETPEFAPNIVLKDITNIYPQPQEGWDYDSGVFNPPLEVIIQTPTPQPTQLDEIQNTIDLLLLKQEGII